MPVLNRLNNFMYFRQTGPPQAEARPVPGTAEQEKGGVHHRQGQPERRTDGTIRNRGDHAQRTAGHGRRTGQAANAIQAAGSCLHKRTEGRV